MESPSAMLTQFHDSQLGSAQVELIFLRGKRASVCGSAKASREASEARKTEDFEQAD